MNLYSQVIELLEAKGLSYRLLDHPPEGRTEIVSAMRGHDVSKAAKCMVVMVKIGKKTTKYVLAVVPGHRKVNLTAVKEILGGTYVAFASPGIAEQLSATVPGTILPFSFREDIPLIVDPTLLENEEIFFNAARLDRSIAMKTVDYVVLAQPRVEAIAHPSPT